MKLVPNLETDTIRQIIEFQSEMRFSDPISAMFGIKSLVLITLLDTAFCITHQVCIRYKKQYKAKRGCVGLCVDVDLTYDL